MRLSVTDKCNLRCRYCMPVEGVCLKDHKEMLTEDEMITAVEAAASLGVKKLRITGGEPLVKRNIVSICRRAALVEGIEEVCLTTNGIFLPKLAEPLKAAGVKRIRIHDLRHSHISLLIDMGFSAVAIADRVGHESIEITFRYAHLFPSKQKEMASRLDELSKGA